MAEMEKEKAGVMRVQHVIAQIRSKSIGQTAVETHRFSNHEKRYVLQYFSLSYPESNALLLMVAARSI